jgi:hypothetical protein
MDQIAITDGDAVEAFINAQDDARQQACAVFIASRVALRMAPVAIEFFEFDDHARKRYLTSVMIWRALLTSGVASTMPTPDVRTSAAAASRASSAATDAAASRASSFFANDAGWAEVTRDAALWLRHADQGDGTLSISIAPLWSDENPLDQDWHSLRENCARRIRPMNVGQIGHFGSNGMMTSLQVIHRIGKCCTKSPPPRHRLGCVLARGER